MMRNICILGSTGSIGENTLDVIRQHPDKYRVVALTANSQLDKLVLQCEQFSPEIVVVGSAALAKQLGPMISKQIQIHYGQEGLLEAVRHPAVDTVMAAIVGAAGLLPTIEAAKLGKRILLANKEALVMSGAIFMDAIKQSGAKLLPIDSEHNAIYQCLTAATGVSELILTASGGPFLNRPVEELIHVTPDQACAHPNWVMGRKISVDSATMMNKGLELIEAMWLFEMPADQIKIIIHPQSVIHSMVRFIDGSILAQMGQPDMRTPIAYGLAWPERIHSGVAPLQLEDVLKLSFQELDLKRFPVVALARQAAVQGGSAPCVLNAANEIAVDAFLKKQIGFLEINRIVETVLEKISSINISNLDEVLEIDTMARTYANQLISNEASV